MSFIVESTTQNSETSLNEIKFVGIGIDFEVLQDGNTQVVIAEPALQGIPPDQRRSHLLNLNLQQIREPDGTITLNGQVAARIRNLIVENQQGQQREIATDRGNFSFSDVQAGVYQVSNADQPQEKTSVAVAGDGSCDINDTVLSVLSSEWPSDTQWYINFEISNSCQGAYLILGTMDDGRPYASTTIGRGGSGSIYIDFFSTGLRLEQNTDYVFYLTSNSVKVAEVTVRFS